MADQQKMQALLSCLQEFDAPLLVEEDDYCLCCLEVKHEGRFSIIRHPMDFNGKKSDFVGVLLCNRCREDIELLFPLLSTHIQAMEKRKLA